MDPLQWSGAAGPRDVELTKGRDDMAAKKKTADDREVITMQRTAIGRLQEELARAEIGRTRSVREIDNLIARHDLIEREVAVFEANRADRHKDNLIYLAGCALGGLLAAEITVHDNAYTDNRVRRLTSQELALRAHGAAKATLELIEPTEDANDENERRD